MKQYCRYCAYCISDDLVYCSKQKRVISESKAKSVNKCKDFKFNEIDALGGDLNKIYKPREKKLTSIEQGLLFTELKDIRGN